MKKETCLKDTARTKEKDTEKPRRLYPNSLLLTKKGLTEEEEEEEDMSLWAMSKSATKSAKRSRASRLVQDEKEHIRPHSSRTRIGQSH